MEKTTALTILLVVTVALASLSVTPRIAAEPLHGAITIGFDDAMQSQFDYAWPLMQARGIVGTFYTVSSFISDFSGDYNRMGLNELHTLQNAGNEIGSHSVTHEHFETMTDAEIEYQCGVSQQVLRANGFSANNFAFPYGDTNDPNAEHIDSIVSQYYRSARSAYYYPEVLSFPIDMFRLPGFPAETGDSTVLSRAISAVDQAYNENGWVQIYFHNVIPDVYNEPYAISAQDFEAFLDYVVAKGIPTVTVNQALDGGVAPLSTSISPTSARLDVGGSQVFTSSISGGVSPYSYRWYLNGSFTGATGSNWAFSPTQAGHYNIYLRVTDNVGTVTNSNTVTNITVYGALTSSISPTSMNLTVGNTQQFTSTVTGGFAPYTYQWYYANNTAITGAGATGSTLNYKANFTGIYNIYLNVTDALNYKVKSNTATLNVYSQPSVTISPITANMTIGGTQLFDSNVAGGLIPYTYQWYYVNGTAISGAATSNLTYRANFTGSYSIYLNVTDNLNYRVKSNIATFNVYSQPTVTINPTSLNMTAGKTQQFTSTVTGGLVPYSYQWYYANNTAIAGATNPTLNYKANFTGSYSIYLNVTDNLNYKAKSNSATVNVYSQPTVMIAPTSSILYYGQLQTFNASTIGGLAPYTYQWYINNTAVPQATYPVWIFTPKENGNYRIHLNVTDTLGSEVKSNIASDINVYGVYLMIDSQASYLLGEQVSLKVTILNQQNPKLETSLALTITGPADYSFHVFQPINVSANSAEEYSFVWVVPNVDGTYIVEAILVPAQLTAYDSKWLQTNEQPNQFGSSEDSFVVSQSVASVESAFFMLIGSQVLGSVCSLLFLKHKGKKTWLLLSASPMLGIKVLWRLAWNLHSKFHLKQRIIFQDISGRNNTLKTFLLTYFSKGTVWATSGFSNISFWVSLKGRIAWFA